MAYKLRTDQTWPQVEADIREQLSRWGCSNYSLKRGNKPDGDTPIRPAANWRESPDEATVTLTAKWPEAKARAPLVIRYNKQDRAIDNARVIFLAVESLRLNEVRGIDDVMRAAYLALPAPGEEAEILDPYEILGILRTSPDEVVEGAYKALARANHDAEKPEDEKEATLKRLNKARDMVRAERGIA